MFTFFTVERVSLLLTLGFRGDQLGVLTLFTILEWSIVLNSSCVTVKGLFMGIIILILSSDSLAGGFTVKGKSFRYDMFSCAEISNCQLMAVVEIRCVEYISKSLLQFWDLCSDTMLRSIMWGQLIEDKELGGFRVLGKIGAHTNSPKVVLYCFSYHHTLSRTSVSGDIWSNSSTSTYVSSPMTDTLIVDPTGHVVNVNLGFHFCGDIFGMTRAGGVIHMMCYVIYSSVVTKTRFYYHVLHFYN